MSSILEVAVLNVKPAMTDQFEAAFREAQALIAGAPGYIAHELLSSVEHRDQYLLLVRWESVEAHEIGFRGSAAYQQWKALLHHFYDPFPSVDHYQACVGSEDSPWPGS